MTRPEYEDRTYRSLSAGGAGRVAFQVAVATTDLYLRADRDLTSEARAAARRARGEVEAHIRACPAFASSLAPLDPPPEGVTPLVAGMYAAGRAAGVGPMAAVAGAIAGAVGRELRTWSQEVLVENGGDLYLDLTEDAVVGLFAGASPFSGRLGLRAAAASTPLGVCTSSGTVGPSLSYGRADAATVLAADPALADAVATALGNRVQEPADLQGAVEWALGIPGIRAAVAILRAQLAAAGEVEFVDLTAEPEAVATALQPSTEP